MKTKVTMLELVTTVGEFARSEAEVIATVAHMVNSGLVELCGNFRGARSCSSRWRAGGLPDRRSIGLRDPLQRFSTRNPVVDRIGRQIRAHRGPRRERRRCRWQAFPRS
jgi:hypothetical protein